MKKVTDFIVNHCYLVLLIMVIIAGLSIFVSQNVKINHDIMKYMPESSETAQGKRIMDEEFGDVVTSNYTIMFENLDDAEKEPMKEYFESVEGVEKVAYDGSEDYNREKDGTRYTLYSIDVNSEADGPVAASTYKEIHEHLKNQKEGDDERYTFYEKGDVASSNGTILNISVIITAIGVALLIITIMSESFIEPWLYLISIGIAVVINKGTNIIFPDVSHVTDSIAAILQLALSMDYSIMLAERYRQERKIEKDKFKAMRKALSNAFGSISASSVTTIVGLFVLIFMSFTIGRDMGLVLSKGVLLSLISIFTTLPAFLLFFDKWIMNSKKKSPRFNMAFMGKWANKTRFIAIPVFLIILLGAMVLKGNVGIEYTSASNNKIGEIFDETNQIAIIYDNSDESRVAKICQKYGQNEKVKEALCFSNTIGEQKYANELKDKASELGAEMDVEDYLIKVLYYHYFDPNEENTMSLEEFVNFVQGNIINNKNFSEDIDTNIKSKIERLSNFVVRSKMNEPKTLGELAQIFEMDESSLRKIFVLYGNNEKGSVLGNAVTSQTMTLGEFSNFVNKKVLTNPEYASEVNSEARAKLKQLEPFLNKSRINAKIDASELGAFLGIPKESVEKIFQYEAYLNYRDENGRTIQEIESQKETTKALVKAQVQAAYIAGAEAKMGHQMTDEQKAAFLALKDAEINQVVEQKIEEGEKNISNQITNDAKTIKNAPIEFVNFILTHQNDEKLKDQISNEMKSKLMLAKTVMDSVNNNRRFSYIDLANTFNLNQNQLRLLYSLNYFENINRNPSLSVRTLVGFINNSVLNNQKYSANISPEKRQTLAKVTDLMNRSIRGDKYNHIDMYNLLSSLSSNLKQNLIDLLYMYHGSLYNYNEDWAMSLEEFINYLHGTILNDARFNDKIDTEKREKIETAHTKVLDAKHKLIGENHSRAVLNTKLEQEGDETFAFIENLKNDLNNENAKAYVIGSSPMAFEMSKTFGNEMNFITILTMVSIFVVVAITFRSILIPAILVLIIQSAVWITMSILSFTGSSVYFIALIIVQSILMGATIDYAILFTSYYIEHRKNKLNVKDALIESYNKAFPTIITSASVLVIVTYIVGSFDKQGSAIAAKICITISEGTLCAAIIILLILPALLAGFDKLIMKRKLKAKH